MPHSTERPWSNNFIMVINCLRNHVDETFQCDLQNIKNIIVRIRVKRNSLLNSFMFSSIFFQIVISIVHENCAQHLLFVVGKQSNPIEIDTKTKKQLISHWKSDFWKQRLSCVRKFSNSVTCDQTTGWSCQNSDISVRFLRWSCRQSIDFPK